MNDAYDKVILLLKNRLFLPYVSNVVIVDLTHVLKYSNFICGCQVGSICCIKIKIIWKINVWTEIKIPSIKKPQKVSFTLQGNFGILILVVFSFQCSRFGAQMQPINSIFLFFFHLSCIHWPSYVQLYKKDYFFWWIPRL